MEGYLLLATVGAFFACLMAYRICQLQKLHSPDAPIDRTPLGPKSLLRHRF